METNTLNPASHSVDFLALRKWPFFIALVAISVGYTWYINVFYNTAQLWASTYGEQMTLARIDQLMETGKRYRFIAYLFIPLVILLRVCYNTVFVAAGNFLSDQGLHLSQIYNACMKAEIAFALMTVTRLLFIEFFWNINSLQDLNHTPLSLAQLPALSSLPKLALQPLSYVNLFELTYMLLLTTWFSQLNGRKFGRNFRFVLASYGAGLLVWCIVIIYLSLLFS
jgi:hypothetical protein